MPEPGGKRRHKLRWWKNTPQPKDEIPLAPPVAQTTVAESPVQQRIVASQEPNPATPSDSAPAKPNESAALPESQRLWNAAYDSLELNNGDLVTSYIQVLVKVLGRNSGEPFTAAIVSELQDPTVRQKYMREMVQNGRDKIANSARISGTVGDVAGFILSVKSLIDPILQAIPQAAPAALPWAGVCLVLQILQNPATATQSNLAGIAHVVSNMDWYCALTQHLLSSSNITAGRNFQAIVSQLETEIIELYKALLLYQMKSVCSYFKNQGVVFVRNMFMLDDWAGDLKTVTDAEITIRDHATQYYQEKTKVILEGLFNTAEKMAPLIANIGRSIDDYISFQKDYLKDKAMTDCLRDLYVVDPKLDMERIERSKDKLFDDAYMWIFRTSEYDAFTKWSDNELDDLSDQLLCIKGHAGTGKTMLMIGLIRKFLSQRAASTPSLCFFFCQDTNINLRNATVALRSLIWLLLLQQPYLIDHILKQHKFSGGNLFRDQNAFYALRGALNEMLRDPRLTPVYFVIDALDECSEGQDDLFELISESFTLSRKVKWLLSSRPEVDIHSRLKPFENFIELDTQRLAEPVNAYIKHKLTILRKKDGYSDNVIDAISQEVHDRAGNTFLWAALAFKTIEKVYGERAVKKIKEIPAGLSELYRHMMERIENSETNEPQDCKKVLMAVFLAFRPLCLSELAVVANLEPKLAKRAVQECGSFVSITGETVNMIHQSAKDFLKLNYTSMIQSAGVAQGHMGIVKRSIRAISSLKRNIYDLDHGSKPDDMTTPDGDPLAPLRYSCLYWVDHFCSLNGDITGCLQEVSEFLNKGFLRWLESLSLLGKVTDGVLTMKKLLHCVELQADVDTRLTALLKDAFKFILTHRATIGQAPLQTYGSALIFSPTTSEIRNRYWEEKLTGIEIVAGVEDCWAAYRQTLEGHDGSVSCIAFSPDGKTLATGSVDETVRLWDAETGAHQRTLAGHGGGVGVIAFSPRDATLASTSFDWIVQIWDTETGALQQTLDSKAESHFVTSVAFLPDGKTVATSSLEGTIRLWDAKTTAHRQTIEGHTVRTDTVASSPCGKRLATGSCDTTARLWNAETGAHQHTLEGHTRVVTFVSFSPDGKTLATASRDATARLWDAETGVHQHTLEGHTNVVTSVSFSPDGKTLATASGDATARLWDAETGVHQRTLKGHLRGVNSVVFSPDGKTLATGSDDGTIRLWDAAISVHPQGPEDRGRSEARIVAFSPDGKRLLTIRGTTIQLQDVESGAYQCTWTHGGHETGDTIFRASFSPDSKTLLTGSGDGTIRIWDAEAAECKRTFTVYQNGVGNIIFSPDGKTVATFSPNSAIKLWATETGMLSHTLGHSGCHGAAFSTTGRKIAAACGHTIELWDVETGACSLTLDCAPIWALIVALSPDEKMIATMALDKIIRLWDISTKTCFRTIYLTFNPYSLSFLPDGKSILTEYGAISLDGPSPSEREMVAKLESLVTSEESGVIPMQYAPPTASQIETWRNQDVNRRVGYGISADNSWIMLCDKNVLWLPVEYRGISAVSGSTVAIAGKSGNIAILRFSREALAGI